MGSELACERTLGVLVNLRFFKKRVEVIGEVLVDELEFGDTVFVIEWHGSTILDRITEVVDADVIAELLPRRSAPTKGSRLA